MEENINELLEELNKIKNTKDVENIEEIIQKAHRIKNTTKELKKENERLSNRFGLVWKNIPEKFVKYVCDSEIVYDRKLYEYICDRKNSNEKSQTLVQFELGNEVVKAKKEATTFSFSFKGLDYLTYSNKIYKFKKNVKEDFVPYLKKKGGNFGFGDDKKDLIIEGDNYFALQTLLYTHKNKVDLIYIDPPYNTGSKDFKYNDHFITDENGNKHSAWLSFMKKRLLMAKEILSKNGVIAISIKHQELYNLKLLMDSVFREKNFLNDISVKMSTLSGPKMAQFKDSPKRLPNEKESVLIYGKKNNNFEINIPMKNKIDDVNLLKDMFFYENKGEYNSILLNFSKKERDLIKKLESSNNIEKENIKKIDDILKKTKRVSLASYMKENSIINDKDRIDFCVKNSYRIFRTSTANSILSAVKEKKEIYCSDFFCVGSKRGILYVVYSKFKNESKSPRVQVVFADNNIKSFYSDIWYEDFTTGLSGEMPKGVETFKKGQKPVELIKKIISLKGKNAIVLDFFAGSGTTGHAVWDLNKEDQGNRRFILCTNNEGNICEDTTFKRLRGVNEEKKYGQSLEYLKLKHASISQIKNADKNKNFEYLKELINLKYNSFKIIKDDENFYINENIAVLKNEEKMEEFFETYKRHKNFAFLSPYKTVGYEKFKKLAKNVTGAKEENIILLLDNYIEETKESFKIDNNDI